MRHLMSPLDFSVEELDRLFRLANDIESNMEKYAHACEGKKLATLFYEPSTRTRLSFEAAMLNLGGSVLGFSFCRFEFLCRKRGERSGYHPVSFLLCRYLCHESSKGRCSYGSRIRIFGIPVINAGDGGHQHPTQTLTDLLTIRSLKGRLDNLTIGLCGDLKFGRTVHSLIQALVRYDNLNFVHLSGGAACFPTISTPRCKDATIPYEGGYAAWRRHASGNWTSST